MAVNFTDDQLNAIKAKGTVLVSAAAGSGKTAVLTERVIKRITDPDKPVSADRLLIVTFTNASALEMRVRISARLAEECEKYPGNVYLLKQKLLLQNAKICTIDSFCIDLVRKHFGVLGISPDFKVADSAQTDALREKCVKEVLSEYFSSGNAEFDFLAGSLGIDRGDRGLTEAILKIYDFSLCMAQPEKWLDTSVSNYRTDISDGNIYVKALYEYALNELKTAADKVSFILREIVGTEFESKCLDGFSETSDRLNDMIGYAEIGQWDRLYAAVSSYEKTNIGKIVKPEDRRLKDVINNVREEVFNSVKRIMNRMCGNASVVSEELKRAETAVNMLVKLVKDFGNRYYDALNRHNIFTFSHIEQMALKILCEETDGELVPSELSRSICREYDEVLVDEYQDNNNLQDALFFAVSDSGRHLFMVGDVKQSIYGFRNANPDNFLKHKDCYPLYDGVSSPSKVILKANFRSRELICGFVNAFCGSIMQNDTCGMDYTDEERLVCGAEFPETGVPEVDICITDMSETSVKREQADAETVADYIKKTLESEPFLRGENGLRRASYGDFAILLRSPKKRAVFYTDALNRRGIPVSYESGEFFETPEILTAVSLLRVINNPTEDIPLMAVMTSAVFGFTPDEIAVIKSNYRQNGLYARVTAAAANGDAHCLSMLNRLSELRMAAVTMSVSRLLNEIYKCTHLAEIMSAMKNGEKRRSNLSRLLTLATKYESVSDKGLAGFIEEFDRMSDGDYKPAGTPVTDCDAVRIMSIHGSKGLQFPICIIADCGGRFNMSDIRDKLIVSGDYGIGMKYVEPDENIRKTTIAREAMSYLEQKKMISEEIRLFYVAMTRAEERLVISVSSKKIPDDIVSAAAALGNDALNTGRIPAGAVVSSAGYSKWILMAALMQRDGDRLGEYAGVGPVGYNGDGKFRLVISKPTDDSFADNDNANAADVKQCETYVDKSILDDIKSRLDYIYPYSNDCKLPSKIAVTELIRGDREAFAFNLRPQFMSKAGLTPAERGTAAHKFMQFADYGAAEKDTDAEIKRLAEWEFISEEEAAAIDPESIRKFFQSRVYDRIKSAVSVRREYKFMIEYPYLGGNTIVQGIADCIFEEPDGIVILDFKTDNVKDVSQLADCYSEQLRVYEYAVSKIFVKPVKESILYSLHLGEEISI